MKLQQIFLRAVLTRAFGLAIFLSMAALTAQGQMQVYGLWHCIPTPAVGFGTGHDALRRQ